MLVLCGLGVLLLTLGPNFCTNSDKENLKKSIPRYMKEEDGVAVD